MNTPTDRDIKKLFALSLNQCAFPGCISSIVTVRDEMIGEICHIKAKNLEGPRYDSSQTETERNAFENLILLCRNHHKIVDDAPKKYTADILIQFKKQHEENGGIELTQSESRSAMKLFDSYKASQQLTQVAVGDGNFQVAGDYHHYETPPVKKIVVTPRPGAISPGQRKQIQDWITDLVENTTRKTRADAFQEWWSRLKNKFSVDKYEEILALDFEEAERWYRQQKAMLVRGQKTTNQDAWRNARYGAIHAAIKQMGREKLEYYAEISNRLRMKKPFSSLTQLTRRDLDRVYTMVLRDARESGF